MRSEEPPLRPSPEFFTRRVTAARRFYLDLTPSARGTLTVVSGGWERVAPDYHIERRTFPFFTIELVTAGRGHLRLGGQIHPLGPGSVFVYDPSLPHEIRTDPHACLTKYFVNFAGRKARQLLRQADLLPGTVREVAPIEDLKQALDTLILFALRPGPQGTIVAALHLQALLCALMAGRAPSENAGLEARQTYARCRRVIEESALRWRNAEEAARACQVSPAYLCRLFARYAAESPYQFLLRLRLNHAASLLESGGWRVGEVADELGMDPFHFSRAFKRVHGMAPDAFRRARGSGPERTTEG